MFMQLLRVLIYYPFLNILNLIIWAVPGHNATWGIIFLTLLVRLLLMIPSRRAAQAQRKMAELAPLLEELKQEYGDDRQGLAVAQMDLYKKNDINPFGSCLPLLIQLPLLIILYRAILNGLKPNNPYLYHWVPQPPFIGTNFFGISLLHSDPTFVLPIVAAVLQFVLMRMTLPKPQSIPTVQPGQVDPLAMQRQMMYIFPLMTLFIAKNFPAGVAIYWVVTTLFSIGQQYYVNGEKLKLTGVSSALEIAEAKHPAQAEKVAEVKELKKEYQELGLEETTSIKKGVTVTVRKKK